LSENTCKRELLIEVPADVVRQATEKVVREVQKQARIPGFRPGKAPVSFIKQRFSAEIRKEVLQDLVPAHFRTKALEEKLAPVAMPSFEDVEYKDDEPLKFKAVFEVLPEFELGEYRGLEVEYAEPEVKESTVDRALERWRERDASFEPVEDRPLVDGDFADVSFEGHPVSGKGTPVKIDDVLIEIGGKETVTEFSDNLRGAAPGEEREFTIEYPADFPDKRLAGRHLKYQVKVHTIKAKKLADLDDDFAKATGEFDTLEELREDVRTRLLQQARARRQAEAKNKLVENLVNAHDFPVPDAMVERQMEVRMERLVRQLQAEGIDPAKSINWEAWRESQLEPARKEVRGDLILDKVADRENIQVTDDEYAEEVRYMARAMRQSEEALRGRIKRDGTEGRVRYRIRTGKAQEFLFQNAKYVEPSAEEAAKEAAELDHEHEHDHDHSGDADTVEAPGEDTNLMEAEETE
jgi:trigger factor